MYKINIVFVQSDFLYNVTIQVKYNIDILGYEKDPLLVLKNKRKYF